MAIHQRWKSRKAVPQRIKLMNECYRLFDLLCARVLTFGFRATVNFDYINSIGVTVVTSISASTDPDVQRR